MANTIVQCDAPDGMTLTLKLYAVNGNTILNGASGDALTERTNNSGTYYTAGFVTEALTGLHEARITNASDVTICKYVVELVDDTGTYVCVDRIDTSGIAAAPSAAVIADAVWDEVITNSAHNGANSAGKLLRQASASLAAESTVNDASATTTSFVTNLTEAADDFYNNCTLTFLDGALEGQSRVISDYNGTTKAVTFDEAFTSAPADASEFQIAADHVHPVTDIADAVLDEAMSGHTTAGSLGLFLNDQYDLAITGITTGVETRAGKHSVAGTVMMSTNAALSGGTLTAKKPSDDTTFSTYTVTVDASASNIVGMS
ncbi:MAG: hypothetical protein GY758_20540 [Fuerstiella sp.]|nr:hypothetical protein [Fuerstiella sp.]